jgi:tRNA(Ile)-lysidine synthase TilS/MesJ
MAYSGGKDSTYTLSLFVKRYGLNVLALTFDNGFISERSFVNMRNVTEVLGVDHQVLRQDPSLLRRIFRAAAERELYAAKTLERASTICTSCIGLVKAVTLRTALEKGIPFVGFGWSPGQAPIQASVMRTNAALTRATQQAIVGPLEGVVGAEGGLGRFFVTDEQFAASERFPWNIHPLAFLDYNEDQLVEKIKEFGWEMPRDTDTNSTNCLLNAYANQIHKNRYGFHPYVWEIANMVRSGVMPRGQGLEKIETEEDPRMVEYARSLLEVMPCD